MVIDKELMKSELINFLKNDLKFKRVDKSLIEYYIPKDSNNPCYYGLLYRKNKNKSECPRVLYYNSSGTVEYYVNTQRLFKYHTMGYIVHIKKNFITKEVMDKNRVHQANATRDNMSLFILK